jgi:hypothetical protein
LARALKDSPPSEKAQLLEQIAYHLDEAISPASTDAEIWVVLEALGTPEAIAAAARADSSGASLSQDRPGDLRHLTWVGLGLLAVFGSAYTVWPAFAVVFQLAFLAVAVVASVMGRPREAAPLFLIGAYGWKAGILLWYLLQELVLPPHWPLPTLGWSSLSFYVPSLVGFAVGLLWLMWLTHPQWHRGLRGRRTWRRPEGRTSECLTR